MIALYRNIRLLLLRAMLLITTPEQRFRKYGVAAGVVERNPERHEIVGRGWVATIENGFSTACGENLNRSGYLYQDCAFNFIDEQKPATDNEVMRIGWDKRSPQIEYRDSVVVSLSTNFAYQKNYFHWLFDVLPRIQLARSKFSDEKFEYYCQNEFGFQADSLAALGIKPQQVIPLQTVSIVQARKLIVPSLPNAFRTIPIWTTEYLQRYLKPTLLGENRIKGRSRIFVSRRDASHRQALNEIELEQRLVTQGFTPILPSELTITEQATIFASADVVVAVHSAALANLIFCEPATRILEIAPPQFEWDLYEKLANQCQLDYRRSKAAPVEQEVTNRFDYQKKDFKIDFNYLDQVLLWACD